MVLKSMKKDELSEDIGTPVCIARTTTKMTHKESLTLLSFIFVFMLLSSAEGSAGDRSQAFQDCLYFCRRGNCTANEDGLTHHDITQPLYLKAVQWDCEDECRYFCMWYTLDRYARGSYWVPQFYGKWPFKRILGIQEPASTLFSLLNLYAHIKMIKRYRAEVRSEAPFYAFWHVYLVVCVNGWLCSTIFHARDTPLTEKLDYLGAFAMVLFSFYALLVRIVGLERRVIVAVLSITFGAFYFRHVYNLLFVSFDYGYNMKTNIVVGALQILGWLIWCAVRRKQQPYVWRCAATMFLVIATTLLEFVDFPPLLGLFDAHALWHLSTAALPLLWYRFLIDDSLYLFRRSLSRQKLP